MSDNEIRIKAIELATEISSKLKLSSENNETLKNIESVANILEIAEKLYNFISPRQESK